MALDEPTDADEVLRVQGYTFVVERELMNKAQPFTVDMSYLGFHVSSAMPLSNRGSCGDACSVA